MMNDVDGPRQLVKVALRQAQVRFREVTDQRYDAVEGEGAKLIAEGKTSPASGYTFRRWRFNDR